jgi:signal transduction histidine kinase
LPATRSSPSATARRASNAPGSRTSRSSCSTAFLGSLDRRLLAATGLVGLLALGITLAIARSIVRPLGDLRAAARELGRGNLARRVAPRGGREVSDLAHAFNAMASELDRQQALRQTLVHDVTHELRTPLTALRCRLETALDGLSPDPRGTLKDLHEEVLHLGRLVDDLQELALAEARELRLDIPQVRLDEVIQSALRAAGLESDSRLHQEVGPGLGARGDTVRIRQILLNLLTNANRYTPSDGSIVVRGGTAGGEAFVEVRNTGSRLDDEQLRRLFDRFYRTDPSRQRVTGGTGLGLAIVKHLAEAQGGRV